jgi:hypothetical protein
MYGGSTPAGGVFATTTSVAMLGMLTPFAVFASNIHSYGQCGNLHFIDMLRDCDKACNNIAGPLAVEVLDIGNIWCETRLAISVLTSIKAAYKDGRA